MANLNLERSMHSYIKFRNIVPLTNGRGYSLLPENFEMVNKRYASDEIYFSSSGTNNFYFKKKPRLVQIYTNSNLDIYISVLASQSDDYYESVWLRCDTSNKSKNQFTILNTLYLHDIYQILAKGDYAARTAYFSLIW